MLWVSGSADDPQFLVEIHHGEDVQADEQCAAMTETPFPVVVSEDPEFGLVDFPHPLQPGVGHRMF